MENIEYTEDIEFPSTSRQKRGKINFITPRLVAALDYSRVTDRQAIQILSATAEGFGYRVEGLVLNRTTIQTIRKKIRNTTTRRIKEDFNVI